jgi:hemin uptake protein HemP
MTEEREPGESPESTVPVEEPPVIDAARLFGDRREVCLELDGVRYRLRITRRNKLILQK